MDRRTIEVDAAEWLKLCGALSRWDRECRKIAGVRATPQQLQDEGDAAYLVADAARHLAATAVSR